VAFEPEPGKNVPARGILTDEDYAQVREQLAQIDTDLAHHVSTFGFGRLLARPGLSLRDRTLGLAAALAGDGHALGLLQRQLRAALAAGWSAVEVRELIWPVYLYGGLAAVERCSPAFLAVLGPDSKTAPSEVEADELVLAERGLARGTQLHGDVYLQRRERMRAIDADLSDLEVRHGYGRAYMRTQLSTRDRALATICVQLGLRLTDQLSRHLAAARRAGLSRVEIRELCAQTILYLGWPVGNGGVYLLEQALASAGLS
jgi:alkylhydroperoxidase/carboxymuconolactone decarboxylase family protein YurZ